MAVDTTRGRLLPAAGGPDNGGPADHARLLFDTLDGYWLCHLVRRIHRNARSGVSRHVDHWLAVDTTPDEPDAEDRAPDNPSLLAYGPTGWFTLWWIFRRLRVSDNDVLERRGSLVPLSEWNLVWFKLRRHASVTLIYGDATTYDIPDKASVVSLYNPFNSAIFRSWLDRLLDLIERKPHVVRLVYVNSVEHDHLLQTQRFQLVERSEGCGRRRNGCDPLHLLLRGKTRSGGC